MTRVKKHKRIKITSRGLVFTSRGRCRTPILRPYVENCDTILQMLTRDNATIVEVLDSGEEIKLTVQNFASDNSSKQVDEVKVEPKKEEVKAVVVEPTPAPVVEEVKVEEPVAVVDLATNEEEVVEEPVVETPEVEEATEEPVVETPEVEEATEEEATEESVIEEDEEDVEEETAATDNKQHLSRKERRKLEQKQRAEANRQANNAVVGDAAIPADSITE